MVKAFRLVVDWFREVDRGMAVMRGDPDGRDAEAWRRATASAVTERGWPVRPYDPGAAPGARRGPEPAPAERR